MRKTILASTFIAMNAVYALAGGLLTNTNQSAHFLRNPARDASTEIDAAYTNPAGLTQLMDGFHFALNNQSAFQTRTITTTFDPFVGFGGSATKEFKGTASAPIIPSVQAAYKTGQWVLSGNIAVSGGGGKATFNQGLPSFESQIAMIPVGLTQGGIPTDRYSVNSYMRGSSFIYGAQLGGTYEINKMFSAHAGFRLNIVNNGYEGYLRNIQINPTFPAVGFNGEMRSAVDVFTTIGRDPRDVSNKELDVSQSGWGISPILGFNFNYEKLNVGMKYEFKTALNVENKTKIDDTGLFTDGVNTPHDIPALFTVGAAYKIIPQLTASVGFHHFFDSSAKMDGDKQQYINGGISEYLGGLEYQINDMFLVSSGFQITRQGVSDDRYQKDLSFALNSYSIGVGGAVNVSKSVRINIGYFWTTYSDWTKKVDNYAGSPYSITDVFSRTNKVFGAGVDFSF